MVSWLWYDGWLTGWIAFDDGWLGLAPMGNGCFFIHFEGVEEYLPPLVPVYHIETHLRLSRQDSGSA